MVSQKGEAKLGHQGPGSYNKDQCLVSFRNRVDGLNIEACLLKKRILGSKDMSNKTDERPGNIE